MADQATRQFRVWRGDAAGGGLTDYTVPVYEGEVVLDVLHRLQATQAGDLAIRWNCKAGKCGDRRQPLRTRQGLGLCNITKCCTEVCPAGIKITDNVITPMKERSADQRYDPLGRVLRSWRRREDRPPAG